MMLERIWNLSGKACLVRGCNVPWYYAVQSGTGVLEDLIWMLSGNKPSAMLVTDWIVDKHTFFCNNNPDSYFESVL